MDQAPVGSSWPTPITFTPPVKLRQIRSLEEYHDYVGRSAHGQRDLRAFEDACARSSWTRLVGVPGYSYPAGRKVRFRIPSKRSANDINWREELICPVTHLNNRLRASVHLFELLFSPFADERIFISEQVTPLYRLLRAKYPNLVGSEYVSPDSEPGGIDQRGIRHEDLTALSFASGSLDFVLSFDCLEHFPAYIKALQECARVLRPGGTMIWSVPFVTGNHHNIQRAAIVDGEIRHILEPEYHGDPMTSAGCLCFTHFGWEMLEQVRESGFKDAYAIPYASREFGYLGQGQVLFVARR